MNSIGLSFPIRIGGRGGLRMSKPKPTSDEHMEEIVGLTLNTKKYERVMYPDLGSDLDVSIFEADDVSSQTLLSYEIVQALKGDNRVSIKSTDITFDKEDDGILYVYANCSIQGNMNLFQISLTEWSE